MGIKVKKKNNMGDENLIQLFKKTIKNSKILEFLKSKRYHKKPLNKREQRLKAIASDKFRKERAKKIIL